MRAPGPSASFIRFLITYLFPYSYLSLPLKIDPLRFQGECRKKRLNLTGVFLCLLCVVVRFFCLVNACFCCARFSFLPYQAKRLAWGNVAEMTYFVSSGTSNHNSISHKTILRSRWSRGGYSAPRVAARSTQDDDEDEYYCILQFVTGQWAQRRKQ